MKSIDTDFPIESLSLALVAQLQELPQPPSNLFIRGRLPEEVKFLAVVGSRAHSTYGRAACEQLIAGLAGYPVCIVSGLALGIDTIAHKAALAAKLPTLTLPGSGLGWNVLYPANNRALAKELLEAGGGIISEYEKDFRATIWGFPKRNRLIAGIADAVLIIEAGDKSGTLITARLATEYNKNILAVPGPIFSSQSKGTNWLIARGAVPALGSEVILEELGIKPHTTETLTLDVTADEQQVLHVLATPLTKDELAELVTLDVQSLNIALTMLEIKGIITERFGKVERIA